MAVFICQGCGTEHATWEGSCPKCGTSETIRLAPSTDRMVDRVVKGKFKIIRKLGQGGMGAVYLAEQLGIGHRVALKFLKSEYSNDPEIARRFLNEARSYALVAHPNAVAFHDFGQDEEGNLFIAMEYCEGVDLKKWIAEQGRLSVGEAVDVVLQVAEVLATAHEKGVIHRDLKPENIMIRRGIRGVHAKVLDFGIARLRDAGTRLTMDGAIAGTPRYMSPEQVEGKPVDLRADIYSLGVVLYEALTGRQPFDGATIAEILRKQAVEPLPPLAAELAQPALDAVLQKACAKRRDERWPDMVAFACALSEASPTQTHLSVSALQRASATEPLRPALATPVPSGPTGIAVPGTAPDVTANDRTLVRAETATSAPLQLSQPLAGHGRQDDRTQLEEGAAAAVAPKSKAPVIVAGVLGALALAGVAVVALRPGEAPAPPAPTPVVVPPPRGEVAPTEAPKVDVNAEALRVLQEQSARISLGNGRTEFELGKLSEAETYLKAVDPNTAAWVDAQDLLGKMHVIREKLAAARALSARGECGRAVPLYEEILRLNARLKDAADGLARCRAGLVDTTLE